MTKEHRGAREETQAQAPALTTKEELRARSRKPFTTSHGITVELRAVTPYMILELEASQPLVREVKAELKRLQKKGQEATNDEIARAAFRKVKDEAQIRFVESIVHLGVTNPKLALPWASAEDDLTVHDLGADMQEVYFEICEMSGLNASDAEGKSELAPFPDDGGAQEPSGPGGE